MISDDACDSSEWIDDGNVNETLSDVDVVWNGCDSVTTEVISLKLLSVDSSSVIHISTSIRYVSHPSHLSINIIINFIATCMSIL